MPSRYKVSLAGERKWLYRKAVTTLLPKPLRAPLSGWRSRTGRKLGFSTPLDDWFRGWLRYDAEAYLLGRDARGPAVMAASDVESLLRSVRDRGLPRMLELLSV